MKQFLTLQSISKSFPLEGKLSLSTLNDVSFSLETGSLVCIVGPSGCGKTTLLEIVAGLETPDRGAILYNNNPIPSLLGLSSYMMQSDTLFPWRTILENVLLPLEIQRKSKSYEAEKQAKELLKKFGLGAFMQYFPFQLSGGMLQRACLARAYMTGKELLLLDEPFGKLDALTKRSLHSWFLEQWEQHKKTILFVTHDVEEAILLSDRVIVLSPRPGIVVADIPIPLQRPRTIDLEEYGEFQKIKKEIFSYLQ
jgi:ABC-type nitrate/sulfonate/bicarbonate transport system ATPase subunit